MAPEPKNEQEVQSYQVSTRCSVVSKEKKKLEHTLAADAGMVSGSSLIKGWGFNDTSPIRYLSRTRVTEVGNSNDSEISLTHSFCLSQRGNKPNAEGQGRTYLSWYYKARKVRWGRNNQFKLIKINAKSGRTIKEPIDIFTGRAKNPLRKRKSRKQQRNQAGEPKIFFSRFRCKQNSSQINLMRADEKSEMSR